MKTYQVYVCEECGKEARNKEDILQCEAEHLGLSVEEKREYDHLNNLVERWSHTVNEGHIFIKITNDTKENKTLCVSAGDGFVQAIFIPYGITYDDNAQTIRDGGMGSTGR